MFNLEYQSMCNVESKIVCNLESRFKYNLLSLFALSGHAFLVVVVACAVRASAAAGVNLVGVPQTKPMQ